jgi:DNA repair protein RecN (Recombination protein N)
VGRKLVRLARTTQVICVTHLPQIAAMGTTHFHVWKEDVAGRTRARISALSSAGERVEEIARMLAGQNVTDSARAHAAELLDQARSDESAGKRRTASRVRSSG